MKRFSKKICFLLLIVALFALLFACKYENGNLPTSSDIGHEISNDISGNTSIEVLPLYDATSPIDGHTHIPVTDEKVEATCTSEGKTEGAHCSVCGEVLIAQKSIAKKEHRLGTLPAVAPTCSQQGTTEGYGCLDCDYSVLYQSTISTLPHTYADMPYVAPTCSTPGSTGGRHCTECGYILYEPTVISPTSHTLVITPAVEPTCNKDGKTAGSHCRVCGFVTVEAQTIPKAPSKHVYVSTNEVKPSGRKDGHTVGIYCSSCNEVILEEKVLPALGHTNYKAYEGYYGYYFLSKLENADKMRALYDTLDECAIRIHNDTSINIESNKVVTIIDYGAMGLTPSQAVTVWTIYRADHPLYYWMSNMAGYSNSQLTVYAYEDFLLGSERKKINDAIYAGVLEITQEIPLDANEYEIVEILHDKIVLGMDYAYKSSGEPEDAPWAHSVVGFFMRDAGVCETYAKVFQLMLNYLDVENIYSTGDAGNVKHAWNLVRMDDGEWYWFDLTWDDTPRTAQGFNRNYFCVTDITVIGGTSFINSHTYLPSSEYGANFMFVLPERSPHEYVKEEDRIPQDETTDKDDTLQTDPDESPPIYPVPAVLD